MPEKISEVIESVFKFIIWNSVLAIFTAALREQFRLGNYLVVGVSATFVLVMLAAAYVWALINIAVPACNLVFPDAQYFKTVDLIQKLGNGKRRKQIFWDLVFTWRSFLFFCFYFGIFIGMHSLFEVLLAGYIK